MNLKAHFGEFLAFQSEYHKSHKSPILTESDLQTLLASFWSLTTFSQKLFLTTDNDFTGSPVVCPSWKNKQLSLASKALQLWMSSQLFKFWDIFPQSSQIQSNFAIPALEESTQKENSISSQHCFQSKGQHCFVFRFSCCGPSATVLQYWYATDTMETIRLITSVQVRLIKQIIIIFA